MTQTEHVGYADSWLIWTTLAALAVGIVGGRDPKPVHARSSCRLRVARFVATALPWMLARGSCGVIDERRLTKAPRFAGRRETGATGLEPATSGVTGRRSNQLNYAPVDAAL